MIDSCFEVNIDPGRIAVFDYTTLRERTFYFKPEGYGITNDAVYSYLHSLGQHIAAVRIAGRMLGVSADQLREHDQSKLSIAEMPHYARNFHGDKGDPDGFAAAWLHHVHFNEHHWQHWIFPDGFTPKGSSVENGVVFMPEMYVKEMVADWMGASLCYTGEWDMSKWLGENLPKIKLHSRSWVILKDTLRPLGYHSIIDELMVNGLIP